MNSFFKAFNQSLVTAQRVMGEEWTFNGTTWPAIAIEPITATERASLGGRFADVNTTIIVALSVFTTSGVGKGKVVTARGVRLRVAEIDNEGDAARTLICGPEGIEVEL